MLKRLIEILNEKGLDANSFFFLYRIVNNINVETKEYNAEYLIEYEYIEFDENNYSYYVTTKGIELVKYIVKELKKEIRKEIKQGDDALRNSIKEWIDEYRSLFKGTKAGIMGDPKACLDKMVRFFEEYSQFANKEQILKATQSYIQSEAQSNYKYLQRADYFIYKITGKEEVSRLASYCEEDDEVKSNIMDLN